MAARRDPASTATYASLGRRLRAQRLARQWTSDQVAARLRLPAAIVEAMERDDHASLGATFFARSRLLAYAGLVDVPVAAVEAQFANTLYDSPGAPDPVSGSRAMRLVRRSVGSGIQLALAGLAAFAIAAVIAHGHAGIAAPARVQHPAMAAGRGGEAALAHLDVTRDSAYAVQDDPAAGANAARFELSSARKPAPVKH